MIHERHLVLSSLRYPWTLHSMSLARLSLDIGMDDLHPPQNVTRLHLSILPLRVSTMIAISALLCTSFSAYLTMTPRQMCVMQNNWPAGCTFTYYCRPNLVSNIL